MKLTEVQFQPWHTLVDRFFICQNCSWVDYRYAKEKRERFFSGLTNEKWSDVLVELTEGSELDYTKHFEFYLEINRKRNAFIHEGFHWHFKDEELEKIPDELWPVFSLFAQLHNRYIPNLVRQREI